MDRGQRTDDQMCTLDDLFRRQKGYALYSNPRLYHDPSFGSYNDGLKNMVWNILEQIDIDKYDFGVSSARKWSDTIFDASNFKTWRLEGGVKRKWSKIKDKYDGLIVMCAITHDTFPEKIQRVEMFSHDAFVTALMHQLIMSFGYDSHDDRLENINLESPAKKTLPFASVVFMVYKLSNEESETSRGNIAPYVTQSIKTLDCSSCCNLLNEGHRQRTYAALLVSLENNQPFETTFGILLDHLRSVIAAIEKNTKRSVRTFTIGQTFATKKKNRDFKRFEFRTWKLSGGIDGRWTSYYQKEGYDGLLAICAITHSMLPNGVLDLGIDQVDYAKAMEQRLIHQFAFEEADPRLGNLSLYVGKKAKKAYAGVVYVAYILSE